jgi:hypothetical protein
MAVVKGVKEKVHLPLYDAISVKPGKRLGDILTSNVMRFFLDVTGKTKLLTNMQAASLLPHWNTYEARALRVVISDLPAQVPDTTTVNKDFKLDPPHENPKATVTFRLRSFVELKRRIEGPDGEAIRFDATADKKRLLKDLELTIIVNDRDDPSMGDLPPRIN